MDILKKIFILFLALALIVSVLLCSCKSGDENENTDTNTNTNTSTNTNTGDSGSNTNSNTNTNTNTNTGSNSTTNTNTSTSSGNKEEDKTSYDTVVEHGLKVEEMLPELNVFESENTFGSEGNINDYDSATKVDVSVKANNSIYEIFNGGVYRLQGTSVNGQILINLKDSLTKDIILILDNVNMTSNSSKALIFAEKCNSVRIIIPQGTNNTLIDTSANADKGVIHVKSCDLTMDGKGTLNLTSYAPKGRGIFNSKNLTINGGIYNVTTAVSHGIQGEMSLTINGGTFNVTSAKSGLKSGDFDEEMPEEAVEGKVTINGGSINVNSTTNGISSYGEVTINNGYVILNAKSDGIDATKDVKISGGITLINAQKDGIHTNSAVNIENKSNVKILCVNDGIDATSLTVSTSGVIYVANEGAFVEDENGSYIFKNGKYQLVDVTKYPEEKKYSLESCKGFKIDNSISVTSGIIGIDTYEDAIATDALTISGGKIVIKSVDDGIDVSTSVKLLGGVLEIINSNKGIKSPSLQVEGEALVTVLSSSDAVDSTNIKVTGGKMFLFEKLDYGDGKFEMTGGTVVVLSTTNKPATPTSTSLKAVSATLTKTTNCIYGKWLQISMGQESIAFRLSKNYSAKMSVTCISEDVTSGDYTIKVGDYQVDSKINTFVYTGGEFTANTTTKVTVE